MVHAARLDANDACTACRLTVRYRSADPEDCALDGDWYFSMPLADGDLLLAVGECRRAPAGGSPPRWHGYVTRWRSSQWRAASLPGSLKTASTRALCRRGSITAHGGKARFFRSRYGELAWG